MTPERKKALERIVKLLALAEDSGATEAEAEAAREAAYRLMAEYNVSSAREATTEPFEMREFKSPFVGDVWWDRRLRAAVAELNNCWLVWWDPPPVPGRKMTYGISGRPRDLDSYEFMYSIVVRQRTVAWNQYKSNGGPETKNQWLYGYMRGVEDRVAKILADLGKRMQANGHNMLAPISLLEQIKSWVHENHHVKLQSGPMGGAPDGFAAGGSVNLYRGEVGRPARGIGHVRRLQHQK